MKKCKITVMKMAHYDDLMALYENPIEHACDLHEGDIFLTDGTRKPDGLCESAWETIAPFAKILADGGGYFYESWMKNPYSALISCNDGFRPVSFLLEAID